MYGIATDEAESDFSRYEQRPFEKFIEVQRWLVVGGSWGSTLALAYAEAHPDRVSELILFGVTAGSRREFDRVFRGGLAARFPEQWRRFRDAMLPESERDGDVVEATHRLLFDPDPAVREAAAYEWCLWESAIPRWPPSNRLLPLAEHVIVEDASHAADNTHITSVLIRATDRLATR
jgi:proline iminopeptidase